MLRITLSEDQTKELAGLRGDGTLKPAERDRVEMVALSAARWRVGQIAQHLGYHAETVRRVLRRWPSEGWGVVRHAAPGPPPNHDRRAQVETALQTLLAQTRTWTAAQLAEALGEQGIILSQRQTRRYLRELRSGWRRTQRTLRHKQDPAHVAQAEATLGHLVNRHKQGSSPWPTWMSAVSARASR
jgi:transposase